jgi:hypothetical protein
MKSLLQKTGMKVFILVLVLALLCSNAIAVIDGISGVAGTPEFDLTVKQGFIITPDGGAYCMWGYSDDAGNGQMQYPGPTLIVKEGDEVTINLTNEICQPVSMVFPGQQEVAALGGIFGEITNEAPPDGVTSCTYTFTAGNPGTYMYHSGTRQDLQIEMGLVGAIIVRPTNYDADTNKIAYTHADSLYNYEYLFLLTEMDPRVHQLAEMGKVDEFDMTTYDPVYWFINGRCAPDTMVMPGSPLLPRQPYNCLPRMNPGGRMLMRLIGGGRDSHPFHTHGNNFLRIARDGKLLDSGGAGADLAVSDFTQTVVPGATYDTIFTWTGAGLGWDMYGHLPGDPMEPGEDPDDHGKPFPVTLPAEKDLTFGAFYSGSPFLGNADPLPPGQGGLNRNAGFFYMWHSHNEKEMVNFDIFPGGLMTMLIVEPPGIVIP